MQLKHSFRDHLWIVVAFVCLSLIVILAGNEDDVGASRSFSLDPIAGQDDIDQDESASDSVDSEVFERGAELYREQCAACHGVNGVGQTADYEEPLYGDRSLTDLIRVIDETMPDQDPDLCVAEDATAVATYIYHAFYTEESRAAEQVARIEMTRLTVSQYRNALTDLIATFLGEDRIGEEQGLRGVYFNSRGFNQKEKKLERVDSVIDFDFGEQSPEPESIDEGEFSMSWSGSLLAEETGYYEIIVRSQNGVRLWLNSEEMLIDGWVNSGEEIVEHRETVFLLGGRAYSLRLHFFSFEDKTASVQLMWRPPHGAEQVIPARALSTSSSRLKYVATCELPADDSSVGYARGTSVSKLWDEATTKGAIDTANFVVGAIDQLASTDPDAEDRADKIRDFCFRFVERAFRRPLSDEERELYVERHFSPELSPDESLKRVVVLALKSPYFLYLEISDGDVSEYDVAARISFGLWDSLPDRQLLEAASRGALRTEEEIRRHIRRLLTDRRCRSKVRQFFHHWLPVEEAGEIAKDDELFAEFDEAIVSDLRTSLNLFIEDVVWQGDSDYRELLLAEYLVVNQRLAEFYDLDIGDASGFVKVDAPANTRSGILTHPFLMSTLAYHRNSSPIHRGVFVTRNILSRVLNPPPQAIEFTDDHFGADLTMREKVAQLTEPAACQSCHRIINPLGFSLENYDAVGRYRTVDQEKPIDPVGEYVTTTGERVKLTGAKDLAQFAVEDINARRGFVEQLFHHTIKQPVMAYGDDRLDQLAASFADSEFHIRQLIVEIVTTAAMHRPTE